jgi:hypothetical protein
MSKGIIRSFFTLLLVLMIALNSFIGSASASTITREESRPLPTLDSLGFAFPGELSYDFFKSVLEGFGAGFGGVLGSIAACYAVDLLITPVNPPLGVYLATVCPGVGGVVGGTGGYAFTEKVIKAL